MGAKNGQRRGKKPWKWGLRQERIDGPVGSKNLAGKRMEW
jgi:hypothetical protein